MRQIPHGLTSDFFLRIMRKMIEESASQETNLKIKEDTNLSEYEDDFEFLDDDPNNEWEEGDDKKNSENSANTEKNAFNLYEKRVTDLLFNTLTLTTEFIEKYPKQIEFVYDAITTVSTIVLRIAATQDLQRYKPETITLEKNRPPSYLSALKGGVSLFEKNQLAKPESERLKVHWNQNTDFMKTSDLINAFDKPVSPRQLEELNEHLKRKNLPAVEEISIKQAILLAIKNKIRTIEEIVIESLQHVLPSQLAEVIHNSESGSSQFSIQKEAKIDYSEIEKTRIELMAVIESQKSPVGVSFILASFLETSKGDLASALYLTTSFLYMIPRRSQDLGDKRFDWFKKYIKDEYSFLMPFSNFEDTKVYSRTIPPKVVHKASDDINFDYSLENQVGKAYHAANLVSLLHYFPPEFIAVMTVGEYIRYGHLHGLAKIWSDFRILKELPKIQKWLRSLPKAPNS